MTHIVLRRHKAFTFVEIIIASVISISLAGFIYNVMSWSIGRDKISSHYTESVLEARKILIKIQKELREARDLIYPSTIMTNEMVSTQSLIYKDRNGILKIINFDKQTSQINLYSLPINNSGQISIVNGSIDSTLEGKLKHETSKFILGSNVNEVHFTYRKNKPGVLQFRLKVNSYNLINALRLLNV
tara:strand:+ start:274 stop:834 length:561 start_codon:yes stop_codon:yes gene_type:complete